jgi:hypothetical protein
LNKLKAIIAEYQVAFATTITVVVVGLVTAQNLLLSDFGYETEMVSFYHNYLIFKHSFFHLLENVNLYTTFPGILQDQYKYSPTFALFFGLFANLPDALGLFLWNGLNALVFYALWQIQWVNTKYTLWVWGFVLLEFVTNIQNSQSNGLMAGLLILGFVFAERKNLLLATLMIVLSVFIKLFGLVAFILFLFYPEKWKAFGYSLLWAILLFAAPLLVISFSDLLTQYQNWMFLLAHDKPVEYSLSVLGWLKYWFGWEPSNLYVLLVGAALLINPFIRSIQYKNIIFRQLLLSSVLIWVVLFNHKAESPTFIIAIAGVAIWYFSQERTRFNTLLLILVVAFTQLAPTDIYPVYIRDGFFKPWVIKVVPIILVWFKIQNDLFALETITEVPDRTIEE